MKSKIMISLTGGLGNQLFQLSAAIHESTSNSVALEWNLGKPRLNNNHMPEVTSFDLGPDIVVSKRRLGSKFISKCNGYVLRMGLTPRWYERNRAFKFTIKKILSILNFMYLMDYRTIYSHKGIGYSPIHAPNSKVLLLGYFQSYRWASDPRVNKFMSNLKISNPSKDLLTYCELAKIERPLVVHVRLGDYKSETTFGIVGSAFYSKSIGILMSESNFAKIWVFSDEIESARNLIPQKFHGQVRWMPEINESASETLELMRYGNAYVIGNSTFSWWAAYLSYNQHASVIAPEPWFKQLGTPEDLIPNNWRVLPADF
jgi:hypothetical protein